MIKFFFFIFFLLFSTCYISTNKSSDVLNDGEYYYPEIKDDGFDLPDRADINCDETICVECECYCPDGSTRPFEGWCYSVCEEPYFCFDEPCPPGWCHECSEPPVCSNAPADGVIGRKCTANYQCELGSECFPEYIEYFNGETYTTWKDGYCALIGPAQESCDPEIPSTCPDGSKCIYLGEYMGREWYGCFDACSSTDASGNLYDWACGCREGYQCSITENVCFPGCSNDRECCELWNDANNNGVREQDEVTFFPDCNGYCDDEMGYDCKASYSCIYPGDESASIGDRCQHDYQCTPQGTCLSSLYIDPQTGEPYYPGGYCTILRCDISGRECLRYGGVCANFSGFDYRNYMCLAPCDTGTSPETPGYKCRSGPSNEALACFPVWSGIFIEDPPHGEDGFCWFGNFSSGTKGIGEICSLDEECISPFGLGSCIDWMGRPRICSVSCNEKLVRTQNICGGVGSDGIAEGVCGWNYCFKGCNNPDLPPGENGCPDLQLACAPLYILGTETYVPEGSSRPRGICLPQCTTDEWCRTTFGPSRICDPVTKACK